MTRIFRSHGGTHHIHADEQHPKARHDPPDGMEFRIFKKYNQNHAGKSDQGRQRAYIQRNQKAGDGCADIGKILLIIQTLLIYWQEIVLRLFREAIQELYPKHKLHLDGKIALQIK